MKGSKVLGLPEKIDYESLLVYGLNYIQKDAQTGDTTKVINDIYVLITQFAPYWIDDKKFKEKSQELYEQGHVLGLLALFLTKMKRCNLLPSEDLELTGQAVEDIELSGQPSGGTVQV